jgi:replication-associated recombination protein RarA
MTPSGGGPPWLATTKHGYHLDEVVSALQKTVRRGLADQAMFWAMELDQSGYTAYAFRRLMVIASEDVGLADPMAAVVVAALYANACAIRDVRKGSTEARDGSAWGDLFLVEAAMYLARAKKNREICHAACTIVLRMDRSDVLPMPEFAVDMHTRAGRSMGRGEAFFDAEGGKLEPHVAIDGDLWHRRYLEERPPLADE